MYLAGFTIDIGVALLLRVRPASGSAALRSLSPHAVVLATAGSSWCGGPGDLAVRRRLAPIGGADRARSSQMWLAHAAMPNDRWFLDLLVSAVVGAAVYADRCWRSVSPPSAAAAIRSSPPAHGGGS